jgi:two-component system response regulator FixJ
LDGKPKLVMIDDDPGVLRALSLLVTALGFDVKPFQQAIEGLDYISENSSEVALIVSDLRMPEHTGLWVLEQLKIKGISLPLIIMSGHATAEERAFLAAAGASGFISKPFNPSQFMDIAKALIRNNLASSGNQVGANDC